ncbi:2,5-diketo-D-gluconic acid reductase [Serinicoccus chungangensis]|uniref:2,5-diketo-D-gluconic acid reductase n=1 Tax=Serinicoccus chungangensis TaxID=767452 RepID=A0A0W8IEJ0_9MICO|nr:aldo/keto reductase [Serinicoccus chungangensis]KUG58354.1 2,5-diketo-D-gluconic acid reductase [Serinicoccus chungangensis]
MTSQPTITLSPDVTIPQLGFGTFQVDEKETQRVVEAALEAGYRHIDTAAGYYNEAGVGAALRASGLARDEVFLTTKLRNGDQGRERARAAFENSREALGVDAVDLYLIHWPVPGKGLAGQTWEVFEELQGEGAVRAIGVSNFLPDHLAELLRSASVTPAVNQIEVHPSFQQPQTQRASREAGVAVEAYAPIGQGADLELAPVTEAAQAHGVSPAQVVIRWHLQEGRIVIPKSATPERIVSNADVFGFELDEAQMSAISGLDTDERMFPDPQTAEFTQFRS